MNRLIYDQCAYSKELSESVAPLNYMLDPIKYKHCDECRIELGLVGGTAVSHISGNLVDLENSLLGIDRPGTKCPSYKWLPVAPGQPVQGKEYVKPVTHPKVDTTPKHLRPCQMQSFPGVPQPPPTKPFVCGAGSGAPVPAPVGDAGAGFAAPW